MYKTRGFFGESAVSDVACPITGRWRFTCNDHDNEIIIEDTNKTKQNKTILIADSNRGDQLASCASPASRASDCPTGRNIDLRFQVIFNGNQDSQIPFPGFSNSISRVAAFQVMRCTTSAWAAGRPPTGRTTSLSWTRSFLSLGRRSGLAIDVG